MKSAQLKKLYEFFNNEENAEITEADLGKLIGKGNSRAVWAVFRALKDFELAHQQELAQVATLNESISDDQVVEIEVPVVTE